MPLTHTFANKPFNRDEDWITRQSQAPRSRFLPFHNLNVLLTHDTSPEPGWLGAGQVQPLPADAEWFTRRGNAWPQPTHCV